LALAERSKNFPKNFCRRVRAVQFDHRGRSVFAALYESMKRTVEAPRSDH
jgi:hypothetical protein